MLRRTALLVVFLLQTLFLLAQQGLTPMDIAKIQSVGDVLITDDGQWVAYTLSVQADPLKENKPARYELHLLNTETMVDIPFVIRGSVRQVAFRSEHNTLTYLEKKDGDKTTSLYEIPMRGGESRKIFSYETSIVSYAWGPGGGELAFIAAEPTVEEESKLPYQPEVYEENLTYSRAYVVSSLDAEVRTVDLPGNAYHIAWSPDGTRMAVSAAPTPMVDDYYMNQAVHIIDPVTLKPVGKVEHEGKLGHFAFSPGGDKLAMIAGADIHDPIAGRLFVVDAAGGAPQNLQPDFPGMFEYFEWENDDEIHFLASEGVWSTLGSIRADGSDMVRMLEKEGPVMNDFDRSDNGHFAFVAETPRHPPEVYLMKSGAEAPERATIHNEWLKDKALAPQEVITYEARDGKDIQAILIHPLDREENRRYPLITVVHGGPEAHYDNGWLTHYSAPGQAAAAEGYAVVYPNYRGSTGRGVAFAKSSQGDLAGKEFDDVVDGVDFLIDMGLVDSEKVGVTGGSYGGYATGWLSTKYTDRFAAGVMFVGISNNISKWGTGDIPEELFLVHARKRIWDDYDFFLERSPIYYAGQAKTPLLILAGKEDTRVHPSQSIELYRHIKTRTDTPVRLVLYPGEGHGNRNATARLDYTLRLMRWFGKYLQGEEKELQPAVEVEAMR